MITLTDIIAYAKDSTPPFSRGGTPYEKTVGLITAPDKSPILSFGNGLTYNLHTLKNNNAASAAPTSKFYLERAGRNHDGSPVYIYAGLLQSLVSTAEKMLETHVPVCQES